MLSWWEVGGLPLRISVGCALVRFGHDASLHVIAKKIFLRHAFNDSMMYCRYFLNC